MNPVGQHLGTTAPARGSRLRPEGGFPARTLRALLDGGVRDRDAATWAVAAVLTLAWWAAFGWLAGLDTAGPATGAALCGGWSLSLLPVHCAARFRRNRGGAHADAPDDTKPAEGLPRAG
jgi:hypothetical protein